MPNINSAVFKSSSPGVKQCPDTSVPEFAFIGRSNVGKSSLINMITGRSGLAKTSATPGKTRLINHFMINDAWYLVDLPGYGFARVPKAEKEAWEKMIREYLQHRKNLVTTFVLVDARHEPQAIDLKFMQWMGEHMLPFALVFTKTDKLTTSERNNRIKKYRQHMLESWEELPPVFITSAEKKSGGDDLLTYISDLVAT